ncbi:MAG TPA: alpha/beta hydrolase [Ferruginibacter sp.]|nr:alpha/beta hydrolase [Ferruginibacter sp.]
MRSSLFTLTLIIACSVFNGCSKSDPGAPVVTVASKTLMDVAYGTDAKQTMDIYLPAGRRSDSTKIMVMIHGGGWTSGDKSDFNTAIDSLKQRLPDYGIFNINYRLSTGATNTFPTQELDVQAAVRYIFGKASDYQVNNQKIVLLGASAGGHLAMLQGYKDSVPVKPKAIVSFFGPSDLIDMYFNPVNGNPLLAFGLAQAIGKTPVQDPLIYLNSSPINFITPGSPPTILLHGGADPLVSPSQSVSVSTKLTLFGVQNQYVFYPTAGHGGWDAGTYTDAFNKIQAFLAANVH